MCIELERFQSFSETMDWSLQSLQIMCFMWHRPTLSSIKIRLLTFLSECALAMWSLSYRLCVLNISSYHLIYLFNESLIAQSHILHTQYYFVVVSHGPLAGYVKLRVSHAPGMPGTFSPPPQISNPDMPHGTCVTHVPRCMSGSLTIGFR